jgi:hypothetical protein
MDLKKLLLSGGQRTNTKKGLTKNLMEQFEDIANLKKTLSTATHFTLADDIELEDAKTAGGNELKLFKGAKFKPGKNFKTSGYLVSNTKYQIVGSFRGSAQTNVKTGVIYYSCKTGKFIIKDQNRTWYNDGDSIELENAKKTFTKFCGIAKELSRVPGGGNSPTTATTTTTTTIPSRSSTQTTQSQTPTLIKQIQKTIGVTETGKLTDTEIQTIYDKLDLVPINTETEKMSYLPAGQIKSDTAPTELVGVKSEKNEGINEEINRIKEMMGFVLNEQTTTPTEQPEKTPTEKLQELLNTKFSAGLTVDGKMGPKTAQAIINALGKTTTTSSQVAPTPSSTNQTSTDTKPTDNTSSGTPKQKLLKTF